MARKAARSKKGPKQPAKASKEKAAAKKASAEQIAKSPAIKVNSKARAEITRDVEKNLSRIDSEMDKLKTQRKEQRARIKAAGIKLKAFDLGLAWKAMDAGERTELLDDVEEVGKAIGLGEQLSLFADERAQGDQLEKDRKALRDASNPKNNGGDQAEVPADKPSMRQTPKKDSATLALPGTPEKGILTETF